MKVNKLIPLLLLLASHAFTQSYTLPVPTQFDKFINAPGIEWATYANDSIRFDKVNLSKLLRQRFHKGEIKASWPVGSGTSQADKIIYVNEYLLNGTRLYPVCELPIYDSLGNPEKNYERKPTNKVDSNIMNLLSLTQIFYIENKKLQSYIVWVSPQLSVYTGSGIYLGNSDYFNTCFNFKYYFKSSASDKLISLGTTHKKINADSLIKSDRLKELYGKNIIETLWGDLQTSKNKIINAETGEIMSLNQLDTFSISASLSIPVYDSLGNVLFAKTYREPASPTDFKEIEITQNWFYNYTKNILVNNIPEVTLYAEKFTGTNTPGKLKSALKIIFK